MTIIKNKNSFKNFCIYLIANFIFLIASPYITPVMAQNAAGETAVRIMSDGSEKILETAARRIPNDLKEAAITTATQQAMAQKSGRITDEPSEPAPTVEISLGDTGNPVGPKIDLDDIDDAWVKKSSPVTKKAYVWSKTTAVSTARATGEVFKDNFTAQSIAINAGAAFASKLFDQYNKGEKLDVVSAAKFIVSGESISSFMGAALGATAGTAVGTFIATGVPVVGPAIGALMPVFFSLTGSTMGTQMGRDLDSGNKMSFKRAWAAIDKPDLIGRTIGATIGMTLGNMLFPGLGGFIGSVAGNIIGSKVVSLIRMINDKIKKGKAQRAESGSGVADGAPEASPFAKSAGDATSKSALSSGASGLSSAASAGVGGSDRAEKLKKLSEAKSAFYQNYVSLLNEGKGESAEARTAIESYARACEEYNKLISSK